MDNNRHERVKWTSACVVVYEGRSRRCGVSWAQLQRGLRPVRELTGTLGTSLDGMTCLRRAHICILNLPDYQHTDSYVERAARDRGGFSLFTKCNTHLPGEDLPVRSEATVTLTPSRPQRCEIYVLENRRWTC
ncbi:hypothetical protein PISMIDRAFT_679214 [Pisolithus microcarpus 441]|uniref:Uncharacterized protein n=1 Tax=Pisolithus microcarpus 441 TaxID=765257 RepID=A0A0C9YFA6_9AGAM|nr:hypothetical protein PISMIDRAFT_679214 [Pisolithus microcarpus 441]